MTTNPASYGAKCTCIPADGEHFSCTCPCGAVIKSRRRHVFHVCSPAVELASEADNASPTLLEKARNFTGSLAKHVAAGMPQASEEEIARRFAICQGCEFYDGKACQKCGCPIVREKQFISKLAWADQSCPVGKWGPVAKAAGNAQK